ncbi:MAG: ABC transporter substrate-binding protein [Lactobacillus sp.]|nr:ABC transporter substrate-binding protein [Lactobacillus sp.]
MKKLFLGTIAILLVCLGLGIWANKLENPNIKSGNHELVIYNWGDYIDPKLITKFEKQTGYHVSYQTFDSNEAMFTKLKQGGTNYDLAVPSEYMVSKLKKAHLLSKIDLKQIPNWKNVDPLFLHKSFDPQNNYSLPYFWGTLGIVYNDKFVDGKKINNWNDLWNAKYKKSILLVDSARDIMGMALASLNYSMNTTNSLELKLAKTKLDGLGPNIKAIISDEIKLYMAQNEAALAVTWSGEAKEMMDNNSHLHYIVPKPYSNLWFDNFVIPKSAKNKTAAMKFINFMLEPKNAAQNAEYVGYSTPVTKAKKLIKVNHEFYPAVSQLKKLMVFKDLSPEKVQEYNDLFLEFKMYAR